jgi:hypothetical protein
LDIDVRTNGIHSMAKGLEAFKAYHDNPSDFFALKDSILRSHHALETLFKNVLFSINPVLLVKEDRKIKEIIDGYEKFYKHEVATVLDATETTSLQEAVNRLTRLGLIVMDERELSAFLHAISELNSYRNKLQHYGIVANAEVIGRILGTAIPRGIEILDACSPGYPLIDSLTPIYPESKSVIELLRSTYDSLIQETIAFFNKKEFVNQELLIKINDHGEVGAPPYFAELDITGFLNYGYDIHQILEWRWRDSKKESPYQAIVTISQPTFSKGAFPETGTAKGNLSLDAQIVLENPNGSLVLPDAEEKIRVLREVRIVLKGSLDYEAEAMITEWHYEVRKVTNAAGNLSIKIASVPRGYTKDENEIIAEYEAKLTHENAQFRLHSFVEPSGMLKKNYILEWNLRTKETLKFK